METPEKEEFRFNMEVIAKYFEVVESPSDSDFALVEIKNPNGGVGYGS